MRKHPLLILVTVLLSSLAFAFLVESQPTTTNTQNASVAFSNNNSVASKSNASEKIALVSYVVSATHNAATTRSNTRVANKPQKLTHKILLQRYRKYVHRKALLKAKQEKTEATGVWAKLRACESRGDYAIDTGNGYYGAYQFSLASWRGIGHSGLPDTAPPSVQDTAARQLQARQGWRAWPRCAAELGLT